MFEFRAGRSWDRLAFLFLVPAPGHEIPNILFGESVHSCDHVANNFAPLCEVSDRLLSDAEPRSDILHRQVGPGGLVDVLFRTVCHWSGSASFQTVRDERFQVVPLVGTFSRSVRWTTWPQLVRSGSVGSLTSLRKATSPTFIVAELAEKNENANDAT